MKRFVALITLLSFVFGIVLGDEIYLLNGINSKIDAYDIKTTDQTLDSLTKTMVDDSVNYGASGQILIGHSQGGLRAMAYAEKMRAAGKGSKIKAVITIGSPLQGHFALSRGIGNLHYRLKNIFNNFSSAYDYIRYPTIAIQNVCNWLGVNPFQICDQNLPPIDQLLSSGDANQSTFLKNVLNDSVNLGFVEGVVAEMVPESAFIKANILEGTGVNQGYWTQVQISTWYYPVVVGWNWCVPIVQWVPYPVYMPYYVWPTSYGIPRMASNMRLGNIVGTDNDILNFLADVGPKTREDLQEEYYEYALGISLVSFTYNGLSLLAGNIAVSNWYNPVISVPAGLAYLVLSDGCNKTNYAATFLTNISDKVGDEIYLTRNHDGFVTSGQMTVPTTGALWITGDKRTSQPYFELTHDGELDAKDIWGEGGSMTTGVVKGGLLDQWLTILKAPDDRTVAAGIAKVNK